MATPSPPSAVPSDPKEVEDTVSDPVLGAGNGQDPSQTEVLIRFWGLALCQRCWGVPSLTSSDSVNLLGVPLDPGLLLQVQVPASALDGCIARA